MIEALSLKRAAKKLPGVEFSIKYLSACVENALISIFRHCISWSMATRSRRRFLFKSLPKSCKYIASDLGDEIYLLNSDDKAISNSVFSRGEFDFHKFSKAYDLIKSIYPDLCTYCLVDVGANIGTICIPAIRRNYLKSSMAFELDSDNYRLLVVNCILNKVEHLIKCSNLALGNENRDVYAIKNASNFGDHRVDQSCTNNLGQPIPMIKLDSIAESIDLQSTILWIDVQGFEWHVLKGASTFVRACVPLVLEFSPVELDNYGSLHRLVELLSESKYDTYYDLSLSNPMPTKLSSLSLYALSSQLNQQSRFSDLLFLNQAGI